MTFPEIIAKIEEFFRQIIDTLKRYLTVGPKDDGTDNGEADGGEV